MSHAERLIRTTRTLRREVHGLRFAHPVSHVYNPLDYAKRPHHLYLRRYGNSRKRIILLGMNPGPFGMAQTGVPFGEVTMVRDWMHIETQIKKPDIEHPKRPISGFACGRSEVSGTRLWGAVAEHFGSPDQFFFKHFVVNYCPLIFMEQSGRNVTPDKLPAAERAPLFDACDRYLRRVVTILQPEWILGVGAFARRRAEEALGNDGVQFGQILHPSPANPRANRDWTGEVQQQLSELGLCARRTLRRGPKHESDDKRPPR